MPPAPPMWPALSIAFISHGQSYLWNPAVVWIHVISNSLIALSYLVIGATLVQLGRLHPDLRARWILYLFAAFLLSSALTHIMNIIVIWEPIYWTDGFLRLATGVLAVFTAAILLGGIPKLAALPAMARLEAVNHELASNQEELVRLNAQLQTAVGQEQFFREQAEHQRKRLELATETLELGIWEWDADSDVLVWDARMYRIYGLAPSEQGITYAQWKACVHPDDLDRVQRAVAESLETGKPYVEEFRARRSDGSRILVHATAHIHRIGDRRMMIGTNRDVTADVETLKKVESYSRRLDLALEAAELGIWQLDLRTNLASWNRIQQKIYGVELPSGSIPFEKWRAMTHPDDLDRVTQALEKSLGSESMDLSTLRIIRDSDGETRHLERSACLERESTGEALSVIGVDRDVTETVRASEKLLALNRELERSNRELEDFARIASHDLQEPLRKIRAFADRLNERVSDKVEGRDRQYLERMVQAAYRMSQLIKDLLSYSRVNTRQAALREVDLNGILREVVDNLENRIEQSGATVTWDPLPMIQANPSQMLQLFQNLIGNGLKFHREGVRPTVTIHQERDPETPDGFLEIRVSDNGIGIAPEYLDRIFEVFQRLHGPGEYPGSGVGLAICKKIVERHHGTIRAESTPGEGTTMILHFPKDPSP